MKIALYGKLRSGKTAISDYVLDKFEDVEKFEFSDALRDVVNILYPQSAELKDREKLISVGQHMRKLDKDVWTNIVKFKVQNSKAKHIIVAGVRQENEYEMLKSLGFTFIKVEASESTRVARCMELGDKFNMSSLKNHTEMVLDDFEADYVILNDYGFKELEISASNVIKEILQQEEGEEF